MPWAMISSFEIFMSCPSSALVVGVMIGSGNRSFSFMPSGKRTPHSSRQPFLYSRHAEPVRMERIIISTRKPSHFRPTVTMGSGVASFQLGQMSVVASKNLAAIWLSTCPLKGMPFGSTTSKAEIRSVATITIRSSLMLYTSRTFPWYTLFCPSNWKSVFVKAFIFFIFFIVLFVCIDNPGHQLMAYNVASV